MRAARGPGHDSCCPRRRDEALEELRIWIRGGWSARSSRGRGIRARRVARVGAARAAAHARDDLLLQMGAARPAILAALEQLAAADPEAIVASRLLTSLETEPQVALGDLADVALMYRLGYRSFMLSDGLCFSERAFDRAVAVFAELEAWLTNG